MLTAVAGTGEHVTRNRAVWDQWAADYAAPGERGWAQAEPAWVRVILAGPARCAAGGPGQLRGAVGHRAPTAGPVRVLMLAGPDEDDQPATERLLRPYLGILRFEWPDDESVEFHLGHGEMIRLLRSCGLEVEDLLELRPEADATTRYPFVTLEWARRWPGEEVWKSRLTGSRE
jgi:hypothetical protein